MKKWLRISILFIFIGLISFTVIMTIFKWDFNKFNTKYIELNTYEINEDFNNISIDCHEADINLILTEYSNTKVVCLEEKNSKHNVTISENTLKIDVNNNNKWYDNINIFSLKTKIDVYLSKRTFEELVIKGHTGNIIINKDFSFKSIDIMTSTGDVENYASTSELIKLKTSTGKIKVENIQTTSLDIDVSTGNVNLNNINCQNDIVINVSTGKVNLTNIACNNLSSTGNTGDVSFKNVFIVGKLDIKRTTGDIKFDKCDASEIEIVTDTGDINATLLSDKIFSVETNTGNKNIPQTNTGGLCKIKTTTGDISIQIV